eukprot:249421-Rhodomonas_salina.1
MLFLSVVASSNERTSRTATHHVRHGDAQARGPYRQTPSHDANPNSIAQLLCTDALSNSVVQLRAKRRGRRDDVEGAWERLRRLGVRALLHPRQPSPSQ